MTDRSCGTPFIAQTDPRAGYLAHKAEIDAAIQRVLDSGWYILGSEAEAFEREFATYIGVHHTIGVASGTDALALALRASDVGPGHIVFTVSHTAVATVAAIEMTGATPVLVDIDPDSYTMDPNSLEKALRQSFPSRPKAVIPVHLYGHPADMPAILELAHRYELRVIEDCAQSHGASLYGRMTGAWGDAAAFSFYPTKNLGAFGDGGMVATNSPEIAERVRLLRQYGWRKRFVSEVSGFNSRLDEIQAAILRVKLKYLDDENVTRQRVSADYTRNLRELHLELPQVSQSAHHVYHQFVIRSEKRDDLLRFVSSKGIGCAIHYPVPVHLQPAYCRRVLMGHDGLSVTEAMCNELFSIPMYPYLAGEEVYSVSKAIREFCAQIARTQ